MTTHTHQSERRASRRTISGGTGETRITFVAKGVIKEMVAKSIDFGEMGLGLAVPETIPVGSAITVLMKTNGASVSETGTIRWVHPSNENGVAPNEGFKLGIQLEPRMSHLVMDVGGSSMPDKRSSPDRRRPGPWFNRRNTNRREKQFVLDHHVFLSDTNLVGNTYFAKHFEWQGHVREAFLFHCVNFKEFVKLGVKLITKEASCEFMSESTLGDPVALTLKVGKVTFARLELLFTFFHKITGRVISTGRQIIVFGGPSGKPVRIPDMILKGIAPFQ